MDQLSAMRVYIRVIQTGSFSAAAREQNTSQATVSKKVAALEDKLGVKLITRTSRELSLTQAGQEYYEHCKNIVQEIDEVEASVRSQVSSPKGLLRIAAAAPLSRLLLAPLLAEFLYAYPDIEVDMVIDERHIDLVSEGIDVAIRAKKLEDSSLIARPLFNNPLLLVASPSYLKKYGAPTQPIELKTHNCIVYTFNRSLNNWHFMDHDQDISVPVRGAFRSNSGETNLEMALAGLGITQLPIWMVDKHLESGELVRVLKEFPSDSVPINAIYPHSRHVPLKVRCFVSFIQERIHGRYP
ncbi:LysR family transcriptional regulator [Vibrio alginolyticus]|uniref:LysR family transcriptional regulator n=1 Tax=Vibrio alginolyticus TaxID=663 RepID=UPI00280C4428|nr:LysR family transcriptional regulator [Vibrio alginolyticus]EHI5139720.1 LysR family transcriptional regulator [Vibrio alginolyticus]EJL6749872.1 LysR family transcriptional regulator [Vibrio alginolyticus]EJR0949515.1 LysR family transcriptional regulator [Vibrio alginolyticus]ELB1498796.1 LysR family transcriptional regulator [Vibrio alginolyticus]